MADSSHQDSTAQDPYALHIETKFGKETFGNPYDFQVMGGEITRNAILHALLPDGLTAPKHNALFIVLQLLQIRLYSGARRKKGTLVSKLGDYRYTWDTVPVLAQQANMTPRAFRDNVGELVRIGIIHRVTGTNGETNHYRFTDAAFKMAHALQTPLRVIRFEGDQAEAKGLTLHGSGKLCAVGEDWRALRLVHQDAIRIHVSCFCDFLQASDVISAGWHDNRLPDGNLRHPETLPNWTKWQSAVAMYKEHVLPLSEC